MKSQDVQLVMEVCVQTGGDEVAFQKIYFYNTVGVHKYIYFCMLLDLNMPPLFSLILLGNLVIIIV